MALAIKFGLPEMCDIGKVDCVFRDVVLQVY